MDSLSIVEWGSCITLVMLLALGAYYELKENRLPNILTFSAAGLGLFFGILPGGQSFISCLMGLGLGFSVLYAVYAMKGMGAGDVKMMAAVGAIVGYPLVIPVLVWTSVLGGLMALGTLLMRKEVAMGFKRMGLVFMPGGVARLNESSGRLPTLPYGLAIIGGTMLTLALGGLG